MSAHAENRNAPGQPERALHRYFVVRNPDGSGGWHIFLEGQRKPLQFVRNKIVAVETVKLIADLNRPSEVLIEQEDGSFRVRHQKH